VPENALGSRFDAFDQQGIVPIAYSLFAVALGIAVGSFFKRVLPSIATTLGAFVIVRAVVAIYLRPHYMAPLIKTASLGGHRSNMPAGSWVISQAVVSPHGQALAHGLTPNDLPAACQVGASVDKGSIVSCLTSHGFLNAITFQPANRFWLFQGVESAIFLVLAAAFIALSYWRVLRRDA
jgi:hypothetical protein